MPAIPVLSHMLKTSFLEARQLDVDKNGERRKLSPTAIGFLVPLFVLFLIGPFLCLCLVRGRRRHAPCTDRTLGAARSSPTERERRAREELKEVTDVVDSARGEKCRYACVGTAEDGKSADMDSVSVLGRDCAVCLSTLHAPSQPEPAKLCNEIPVITKGGNSLSISNLSSSEKKEILRLRPCSHEFHAECLVSWFVLRKYSCPICRAVYYDKYR